MFKALKEWWYAPANNKVLSQQIKESGITIESYRTKLETTTNLLDEAIRDRDNLQSTLDEAIRDRDNLQSTIEEIQNPNPIVPRFILTSKGVDPVKGILMDMDWNEAFIQYLKDNGSTGKYDELHVQKFLVMMYHNLIERMEEKLLDKKEIDTTGDFE